MRQRIFTIENRGEEFSSIIRRFGNPVLTKNVLDTGTDLEEPHIIARVYNEGCKKIGKELIKRLETPEAAMKGKLQAKDKIAKKQIYSVVEQLFERVMKEGAILTLLTDIMKEVMDSKKYTDSHSRYGRLALSRRWGQIPHVK